MKKYVLLPDEIIAYLNDSFEELELASYNGGNAPKDKPLPVLLPVPENMRSAQGCNLKLSARGVPNSEISLELPPGSGLPPGGPVLPAARPAYTYRRRYMPCVGSDSTYL